MSKKLLPIMKVSIYSTFNNDISIDLKLDIYMCTSIY